MVEGGVVYYVRADHIGRPAFATDVTGAVVWSASYLPFGEVRVSTGSLPPMRFPGQWFQSESGLHQNWMRDYDPTTGRYLQADPLGLVDGPSVYGYARQNPGRWVDPRGEFIPIAILGGVAIGAGIDLAIQLWSKEFRMECVNWAEVGLSGALGSFSGGWAGAWKAGATGLGRSGKVTQAAYRSGFGLGKDKQVHHAIFSSGGSAGRAKSGFQHSWWNYRSVTKYAHKGLHGYRTVPRMNPFQRWLYGTPEWLLGGEASALLGGAAEIALGDTCGCAN